MKDTTSCSKIIINQHKKTCSSLACNKTSNCLSAKHAVKPKSNGEIPIVGIPVGKDRAAKETANVALDDKLDCEEVFEKELVQKTSSREQKKGLSKLKESASANFDSVIEDLGTDAGKTKGNESSKKKGRIKVSADPEPETETINSKIKKLHTSYKKKETREGITMKFFSFDWFGDSLSKYSAGTLYFINY